jgi:hypothetical protein
MIPNSYKIFLWHVELDLLARIISHFFYPHKYVSLMKIAASSAVQHGIGLRCVAETLKTRCNKQKSCR